MGRRPRLLPLLLLLALAAPLAVACDTPPQVLEISPERNAEQVPSNADVRIRFDRAVDQRSVADRFTVTPSSGGTISWPSSSTLVFHHRPFSPGTLVSVRLRAGYRDASGRANTLNHGWSFTTEPAPGLVGSSPATAEQNVDPSSDLVLNFSRAMDLRTMGAALTITPAVRYNLTTDAGDARRVVVAPQSLLEANSAYSLTVTRDALDVDGNPLATGVILDFTTGPERPLRHWVTFGAAEGEATDAVGVWVVDSGRLPRQVSSVPVQWFTWSGDGRRLLVEGPGGAWSDVDLAGTVTLLPVTADWGGFLAGDRGYVFLDRGRLERVSPGGAATVIDENVTEASIAPGGLKVAYVVPRAGGGSEIRGYEVDLRSRYRLQGEPERIDDVAWAPDTTAMSYRLATSDPERWQVRVRDLAGAGRTLTVATGRVGAPAWLADARHLLLSATVVGPAGVVSRAFRVSSVEVAPAALRFDDAIPSPPGLDIRDPVPSPDGHQVAFLAPTSGGQQVWVMNADGTGLAQLTRFDPAAFPYSCLAVTWTRT